MMTDAPILNTKCFELFTSEFFERNLTRLTVIAKKPFATNSFARIHVTAIVIILCFIAVNFTIRTEIIFRTIQLNISKKDKVFSSAKTISKN